MGEPIAIIGISCRFPGADNPEAFWHLLRNGVDGITEVSTERWDREYFYAPESVTPGKMNTRWGGFLEQIDGFDPSFFQISPREAEQIDPQQRLLLEVTWEALENAGIPPNQLKGSQTGVFIGISNSDYFRLITQEVLNLTAYTGTGNAFSIAANRLSYWLDLKSPSLAIDTACSSSLVAVHLACQSLHLGESNLCLVGGVNLILSPEGTIIFSQAKMMAADGRCKTFDASADGYVRGEGCGIVVLKRLADALRDGDNIQAIIKGSAVNQDGLTYGLTAPNGPSQQAVIRQAMKNAGVTPKQISYIEAHGTGTPLGDPQEFNALKKVIMEGREPQETCWIGSAKTNIGHLESAAGIAGLIKVVLSLQHQEIPPHLHLKQLNPYISLAGTPLSIPTECQPWVVNGKTRLAGVSSFGFGGTNCHVILEEAPLEGKKTREQGDKEIVEPPWQLLTITAKSEQALTELAQRYVTYLNSHPDVSLADICFTANTGRTPFEHRLAVIAQGTSQVHQQLEAFTRGKDTIGLVRDKIISRKPPKIAFLFTGQGSQYIGMGRQLYDTQPSFRATIDLCDEILRPYLPQTLLEVIFAQKEETAELSLLDQTAYTQPALFALEYALAQLWQSWGIKPDVVMGHSIGEYSAACVAGVFSLEDGLKLTAHRGQLMQQLPPGGKMAALMASVEEVQEIINSSGYQVSFASFNAHQNIVISGQAEAIEAICNQLETQGIKSKPLQVSHAFHSPLMKPILAAFAQIAQEINYKLPQIPLISNLTGQQADETIATPDYWLLHIQQPVQFAEGMKTLHQLGCKVFLEVGPKPILLGMGRQCLSENGELWLPSLRPPQADWQQILTSLGQLYGRGINVDWSGFDRDYQRRKIELPTYPFQRKRFWISRKDQRIKENILEENSLKAGVCGSMTEDYAKNDYKKRILLNLQSLLGGLLGINPSEVNIYKSLLEMGADSLILIEALGKIGNTYGLQLTISQLFEQLTTLDALANHIYQNLSPELAQTLFPPSQTESQGQPYLLELATPNLTPQTTLSENLQNRQKNKTSAETTIERLISQQLQLMSQQLEVLSNNQNALLPQASHPKNGKEPTPNSPPLQRETLPSPTQYAPSPLSRQEPDRQMTPQQQQHWEKLIPRYTQRTAKSKQRAQTYRPVMADRRSVAGFDPLIKEMIYPIIGERAQGSRFWDLDGNEYIDISMGFGVLLFGHNPPFITEALQKQSEKGIQIGPQSQFAGEVAQLISELTGVERVAFCNSGTESVMIALRLARTATKRSKIALFAGAYHGHFDGILAKIPKDPGISANAIKDVLMLEYGNPQSIDILQAHVHELAAVLVEPVQSRNPDLQPREFLHQLRELTEKEGIALIFDEVLVGFRIHLGGAQAWFGVQADIVTYGKIVGGGLPIGIIAGKAAYMNGIDGGQWNYGDNSYPESATTFFGGTFNKNHLGMAVARTVLEYLKEQGSDLQQQLNERTEKFATTINAYFALEEVPFRLIHFGSLFRFTFPPNLDLFFYHLIEKGVYIWEGRILFLSTAHTQADIDYIIQAIKESIEQLRQGGFLPQHLIQKSNEENLLNKLDQLSDDQVNHLLENMLSETEVKS